MSWRNTPRPLSGLALNVLSRLRSGAPTDERIRTEFHELVASYEFRRRYETGYVGLLKDKTISKGCGMVWYLCRRSPAGM